MSSAAAASAAALLLLPLLAAAGDGVCPRPTAVASVLRLVPPACPAAGSPLGLRGHHAGVVEGDDGALQKAVTLVLQNKDNFVAILFYASWCPFSKIFRADFQKMPSLFPTVAHFSFEETRIKPSCVFFQKEIILTVRFNLVLACNLLEYLDCRILSRYGIRAFPTLFLVNSTLRVRYHGSRTMSSLAMFYKNVTGLNPVSVDETALERMTDTINYIDSDKSTEQEDSLFVWARSPERLLHQDTCLALASSFVLLRLLHFLLPKLNAYVKQAWGMRLHELNRLFPGLS